VPPPIPPAEQSPDPAFDRAFLKQVGANVRRERKAKGWTQGKTAELTGLQRTYISQIENGTRNLSAVSLARLARAFGFEVERLLRQKPDLDG
jgi:transcriptional regulator with XRE-family HTH domain